MKIEDLKLFINLSETLSFSQTAKNLHMTQPGVTHTINKLEQSLGFKLFTRTKRKVVLTRSGTFLHDNIQSLLLKLDLTIEGARTLEEKDFSSLLIGYTSTYYEIKHFPQLIKEFNKSSSSSRLYLENFDHNVLKQHLLSQQCDVIFPMQDSIINSTDIQFVPLITGQFACIVPVNNPLASRHSISINDLSHETLILFNANICPPRQFKLQQLIKAACPTANYLYSDSVLLSHTLVKAGLGIAIMVDLASVRNEDEFQVVPLTYPNATPYVYGLAFLKSNHNPALKKFVTCAKRNFTTNIMTEKFDHPK